VPNATRNIHNFGRNQSFRPAAYYEPGSEQEVLEILNQHQGQHIRAIGSLHSWSEAPCGDGVVISLKRLNTVQVHRIEPEDSATVGAGAQIKTILHALKKHGKTLPSLGLITEQTIAGAISTGTHGSGKHSLSHYVQAVRIARYDTESGKAIIEEIDSGDDLRAARCSLGCLGVILTVRISIRDLYSVEEHWREYDSLDNVLCTEHEYPLQQFLLVPWKWTFLVQHRKETPYGRSWLAWLYRMYWFLLIDLTLHLVLLFAARIVKSFAFIRLLYKRIIPPLVIRRWKVIDESSAMLVMEHELFRHIETELFVPRRHLPQALKYVREVLCVSGGLATGVSPDFLEQLAQNGRAAQLDSLQGKYCHHYPICVRRVLCDDTLISMTSSETSDPPLAETASDWYAISLISYASPAERQTFLQTTQFLNETMVALFRARPHWGKLCRVPATELSPLYLRMDTFALQCKLRDPQGVFRNRWLASVLAALPR